MPPRDTRDLGQTRFPTQIELQDLMEISYHQTLGLLISEFVAETLTPERSTDRLFIFKTSL